LGGELGDESVVLTDEAGAHYVMQDDGNFVIYSKDSSRALWATHTNGYPGAF